MDNDLEKLATRIWTSIADAVDPALAAIATLMLIITVLALIIRMTLWDRRRAPHS